MARVWVSFGRKDLNGGAHNKHEQEAEIDQGDYKKEEP
jgi:hypothetical protein